MPILFMALIALAVFMVMGLMLFYAAYAEAHTPHKTRSASVSLPGAAPEKPKAMAKAAGA
jgi:hypothetical protein